ncbi:adhesion G protein-coupled receptor L2, partial [Hydra vulgaris]|uniref:adhesion G protein-coupled receptor L2 n=1 Tax=Hydra vulgaris TaxID=6087 RepID=UPI0032E9C28B
INYFNGKRFTYRPNEYIPLANGVGICKESDNNIALKRKTKVLKVANIVSKIVTSSSVLCYLAIIIVYTYFNELRTWSSVTSTTLCINLFFADFTFLISTQFNKNILWCKVFSILLHWFLLVAYHSLLILAIDVATTFGSYNHQFSKRKKLIQYCIVIYVIPSGYLFINIILEKTGVVYIGYGDKVCWIGGFYAKLFSFIIPVVVIILTSLISLLFTVYQITLSEKKSNKVFGEGRTFQVNIAKVTLKLTLILGVIELLGFVQISKSSLSKGEEIFNTVFEVIYMFFRSAKGILLFVAYICTQKVQKLITKSIPCIINKRQGAYTREEKHSLTALSSVS